MTAHFTHTDDSGEVHMVDVGGKPMSARRAVAVGEIAVTEATRSALESDSVEKGDVLATARVGAIQAVKHTWEIIPMCHQIPITSVETDFTIREDRIKAEVAVETIGQTGCEMEALVGVTVGLNVIWDMTKSLEKDETGQYPRTEIRGVRVIEKSKESLETGE